jgi:transposase InsO family protein
MWRWCWTLFRDGWWFGTPIARCTPARPLPRLDQAIAERRPQPGLVHHSDRGVQYASATYVDALRAHGLVPSMSRPALCESFMKTLKREEV